MAPRRRSNYFVPAAITIFAVLSVQLVQVHAGNTTCVSNQLSWYSDVVGESPCMTYQRLRQICNNDYQVPVFSTTVPGDQCDDQVSECCCSMVGFQLSMLCMVCQQDTDDSGGIGIDAPVKGTYTVYRGACGPGVNHTLPSDLQSAICNENIRIDNFLYDSWEDGTWFYVWTKENVEKLHAEYNNNTFTHCPNQISPSGPTPTATSSTVQLLTATPATSEVPSISASETLTSGAKTSASTSSFIPLSSAPPQPSDTNFGAASGQSKSRLHTSLVGGVVGGVLGLIVIVLACVVWRLKKSGSEELRGTHDAHFEHPSTLAPPDPLTLNRLLNAEEAPRTLGTPSIAPTPVPETQHSAPLAEARHHDGGPLLTGRARSNSGLLPPAYEDSWDNEQSRHTHPSTAGPVPALGPPPGFLNSAVSESQTVDAFTRSVAHKSAGARGGSSPSRTLAPNSKPLGTLLPPLSTSASDSKDP